MPTAITLRDNAHFVRDKVVVLNTPTGFPFISAALSREAPIAVGIIVLNQLLIIRKKIQFNKITLYVATLQET